MPLQDASNPSGELRCDLVCEGGGVKGIGLAGAFSVLEERGYRPQMVAGTSAGAITAALIAAGYRGDELKQIVLELPFHEFTDKSWEDEIPLVGKGLSILFEHGIYEGDSFHQWMRAVLERKGVHTFADLPTSRHDQPWVSRLQVVISDLTARELLVLPRDAGKLGLDPRELEVALAVRMSMSIPLFFMPVRLKDPQTGREHVLVDGGLLSNYPVWLFDAPPDRPPTYPTFGLLLVEPEPERPVSDRLPRPERGMKGLKELLMGLVHTAMEAHDRMYIEQAHFARTIGIPTLGVGAVEFGLPRERAMALFDSGRKAAEEFLAHWDFNAYVKEFRSGKAHSRREAVQKLLARPVEPRPAPV